MFFTPQDADASNRAEEDDKHDFYVRRARNLANLKKARAALKEKRLAAKASGVSFISKKQAKAAKIQAHVAAIAEDEEKRQRELATAYKAQEQRLAVETQ